MRECSAEIRAERPHLRYVLRAGMPTAEEQWESARDQDEGIHGGLLAGAWAVTTQCGPAACTVRIWSCSRS